MSENVEIVRRWIDLFNRRDVEGLAGLTEPGFEMKSLLVAIEADVRGYTEFPQAYFEQIDEAPTSSSSRCPATSSTPGRPCWS
jgi:hypothetical protein